MMRYLSIFLLCIWAGSMKAQQANLQLMVSHEIFLLEFVGGGTALTSGERQQAAAIVNMAMKENPQAWIKTDANAAKQIPLIEHGDPLYRAWVRAALRQSTALATCNDGHVLCKEEELEGQILAAHDPVLVLDRANKRVITRGTVRAIVQQNYKAAPIFEMAPPSGGTEAAMDSGMSNFYNNTDDGFKEALSHAEENSPHGIGYLTSLNSAKGKQFIATYRAKILEAKDPVEQQFRLAEVLAFIGRRAVSRGSSADPTIANYQRYRMQQDMMNNALMKAARSGSPTCNTYNGSWLQHQTYCNPYP